MRSSLNCTNLLLLTVIVISSLFSCHAGIVEYNLTISEGYRTPDCFERFMVLINGDSPGPALRAHTGDTLVINVYNGMAAEVVTLHFHGILQTGTPQSDGVPFITQWPVDPGSTFRQEMHLSNQVGTFYYHAHTSVHGMTAYGALIIEDKDDRPPYHYDHERIVLLSDFYHQEDNDIVDGLLSPSFRWIGDPHSILTNGNTYDNWNCTQLEHSSKAPSCGYDVISVKSGLTYRFRIIGAMLSTYLSFVIPHHTMTVIEVDGFYVKPVRVEHLEINAGQRYSVLVEANQPIDNYFMKANAKFRKSTPENGLSILHYEGSPDPNIRSPPAPERIPAVPLGTPMWEFNRFKMLPRDVLPSQLNHPDFPQAYDREIQLTTGQRKLDNGAIRMYLNNLTFEEPMSPVLLDLYDGTRSRYPDYQKINRTDGYDSARRTIPVKLNEVIQIVIQNTATTTGRCDQHPFHLHGHSFFDVGGGNGLYSPQELSNQVKAISAPLLRDVVSVYPETDSPDLKYAPGTPCGWRAIRFIADNPGVWVFHCHITAHMILGMQVLFEVGVEELSSIS
ncbi:hypothetical protein K493DRAFT_306084 [Basidiobolus meristosporus CBS 931.73]|uniref:Cupredoxin n=1 Tax=Basidiobolus meristosporus CBS 931.73 TaxID=1314790 RepID=A0A1Y1XTJ5_9FUNG|nr:hypothetical protein K493DRAFT_306084 [Basidiobolus meristosporus CBS 931.73]|eukprot:ORX89060.1 hypothetical protein K493DRAFT_306084 [Basidiobolus meristosporus CBS 931.73]